MPYSYTHITSSPLYTSTHHTIERLSRSSWQITSPHLLTPIPAKSYAEAKALAAEIDFSALSVKVAEPEPVATVEAVTGEVNPFEVILNDLSEIKDLGIMQGAYDQAIQECDLRAVLGHLSETSIGDVYWGRFRLAVDDARVKVPDDARVIELAGLLPGSEPRLARLKSDISDLIDGKDRLAWTVETMCDLPDTAMYIKRALILWACSVDLYGEAIWMARLRLEGAALRYARERACVSVAQERKIEGERDMGWDGAREWGEVWSWAEAVCVARGNALGSDGDALGWPDVDGGELLPSLLSPEPEHWLPLQDGRVLVVNWRAGETTGEPISAAVWLDDGGLSLLGSYVLGSGWVSDDRLGEEDVDSEALGVILEAINARGLAVIA